MDLKKRIMQLLYNYRSNELRLQRLEQDEMIKEWQLDYSSRANDGGVSSPNLGLSKSKPSEQSIQERLLDEKQNISTLLERLRDETEMTKLLLLQLNEYDLNLISMRYFDRYQVHQICNRLYISKSSFYRKHGEVIQKLMDFYVDIDNK